MSSSIPSVSAISAFHQEQLAIKVSTAVARKTIDTAKVQGDAAIAMLQAAASVQQQALGKEPGKGGCIDTCA